VASVLSKVDGLVVRAPGGAELVVPTTVVEAGPAAARLTLEFFAARVSNPHTRRAYGRAVWRFCAWCAGSRVSLDELVPASIAAYLESLKGGLALASIKLEASALRHWLDYLTERGVLVVNPARSVRTPRLVVSEGKTPVLEREEARRLFALLDEWSREGELLALRDRALFAVMLFGFVRVGAAVKMNVRDFEDEGEHASLVLHEKGGKERRIPCHHVARGYLREYLVAGGLEEPKSRVPLFQSAPRWSGKLSGKPLRVAAAWEAVQRWCEAAGLPSNLSSHSFRATGITIHQQNGGRLEDAQALAGHADARTTRLYVRTRRDLAQREVERVEI